MIDSCLSVKTTNTMTIFTGILPGVILLLVCRMVFVKEFKPVLILENTYCLLK